MSHTLYSGSLETQEDKNKIIPIWETDADKIPTTVTFPDQKIE